eukprot:TRINITY_DN1523_c0_g1_i1.p1 TRINITY_DN1523_c0_g1~~TRINITY_DN1523_c0_g1_i1.p1  ORF type:complete len:540 (+),score=95.02 TRINITY_DN1523_c0_g1_i1:126-1622(+)
MLPLARFGALRRTLSTAPIVAPALTTPPASGIKGALKRMLGPNADPLPPHYRLDESLLPEVPTRVTTLSNGMRVASESRPVGAAVVGVWIDAGTRFEPESVNGAAHFLEHLIFKGTKNRAQRALEVGVEDIGAHLNAYTSREQTVYYARSLKDNIPDMTALLADILQNSEISDAAVDRERDVILREMEEIDQIHEEVLFDYLHGTAYQDSPLARTILGPIENIKSLTPADLKAYIAEHYKPHRMVLAAAGDVEHEQLVELADKHFGSMPPDANPRTSVDLVTESPAYLVGSDVRIRNDDMPVAHFAIAFESCGWAHPDAVSFMVLQSLLGSYDRASTTGSCSSYRLASTLSAIPNARTATTFNTTYTDTGLFGIYATGEPPELDDVVVPVMQELVRNCFKVDEVQLANAKLALKTSLLSQLDGPTGIAEEIGRQLLVYGRRIPMSEWFARIDAVDDEAIKRISNKYIFDREIAITAMGPIHSLPDYNFIRAQTYASMY